MVRAGDSFLLDGIVSRPDSAEYLTDPSSHGQNLARSANADACMPLPPSARAPPVARRGRGGGSSSSGGGGGVMLRVLGMSAQDTLGSLTGRAAAAEWARHQVCAGKPIRDRHHRPAKCADGPSARHSLDGALTERS